MSLFLSQKLILPNKKILISILIEKDRKICNHIALPSISNLWTKFPYFPRFLLPSPPHFLLPCLSLSLTSPLPSSNAGEQRQDLHRRLPSCNCRCSVRLIQSFVSLIRSLVLSPQYFYPKLPAPIFLTWCPILRVRMKTGLLSLRRSSCPSPLPSRRSPARGSITGLPPRRAVRNPMLSLSKPQWVSLLGFACKCTISSSSWLATNGPRT